MADAAPAADADADADADRVLLLAQQLGENPLQYEVHAQYIAALRSLGLAAETEAARAAMRAVFPLGQDIWVAWLADACAAAESTSDAAGYARAIELFDAATADYQMVAVWKEYVAFATRAALENKPLADDPVAAARAVYTRALDHCAANIREVHLIWELVRDFETTLLEKKKEPAADKLRAAYLKMLSIPSTELESIFSEYSSFETAHDNAHYETRLQTANKAYQRAKTLCEALEPHEAALVDYAGFAALIDRVKTIERMRPEDRRALAVRVYERAATALCLDPRVWEKYLVFAANELPADAALLGLAERSTRNCPWSGDLWRHFLRLLKKCGAPSETVQELFDRACSHAYIASNAEEAVKVYAGFVEIQRIDLGGDFETFYEVLGSIVDGFYAQYPSGDSASLLKMMQLRVLEHKPGHEDIKREFFTENAKALGLFTEFWLAYLNFESSLGNVPKVRSLLKQNIHRRLDHPRRLVEYYLHFEETEGSIDDMYAVLKRVEEINVEPAPQIYKPPRETRKRTRDGEAETTPKKMKVAKEEAKAPAATTAEIVKAEIKKLTQDDFHILDHSMADMTIHVPYVAAETTRESLIEEFGKVAPVNDAYFVARINDDGSRACYIEFLTREDAQKVFVIAKGRETQLCKHKNTRWNFKAEKNPTTVFVSKLHDNVTKFELRKLLEKHGDILEIRLFKKEKSFAYVQFRDKAAARRACAESGAELGGAKISVAISNQEKTFTESDQRKVIVKNLPKSLTPAAVREMFGKVGEVVNVNLLSEKSGESKGVAFVEFEKQPDTNAALSMNEDVVEGSIISVSLVSSFNKKKAPQVQPSSSTPSTIFVPRAARGKKPAIKLDQ